MRVKLWIALAVAGLVAAPGWAVAIFLGSEGGAWTSARLQVSGPVRATTYSGPRHLREAQRLIDHLTPGKPNPRNTYLRLGEKTVLSWGRYAPYRVRADCASFVVHVLWHSYPDWATRDFFQREFGDATPPARVLYQRFATAIVPHFTRIDKVTALTPGDIIIIDYQNGASGSMNGVSGSNNDLATPTGHTAIIRSIRGAYPGRTGSQPGLVQYAVQVIDDTRSPHGTPTAPSYPGYPDTRIYANNKVGDGAGYGYMILYADAATRELSGYRWSPTDPKAHLTDHKILAVRITPDQH
jgi:hypothetical protein